MKRFAPIAFLLMMMCAAALSGCQRPAEDHLTINGKVFIFNIRLARAYYALNLNRVGAVPDGAIVRAEFENPAGGPPLVASQKVFPGMTRIDLQSPDLECVVADRAYKIHIELQSPEGKLLQAIDTTLASTADQTVMPEAPLVEGPAYDRNSKAFDEEGRIRFRKACPS